MAYIDPSRQFDRERSQIGKILYGGISAGTIEEYQPPLIQKNRNLLDNWAESLNVCV